jgi:hypothetical protein
MAQRGVDRINHDAHFYGALFGLTYPLLFNPGLAQAFGEQIMQRLP